MFPSFSGKLFVVTMIAAAALWLLSRLPLSPSNESERVNFNWDVRPILSDRCFTCHGPDEAKREAGLRLDTREGAFAPLGENKDRYAIVPGKPGESLLLTRICSTNPDSIMPPPSSNLSLDEKEKKILRKWIEQGAPWSDHWAFIAPERPSPPAVKKSDWAKNPLDLFVLDKMERRGLKPAAEAEKNRLLRRAAFDLTGLPPDPSLFEAFMADHSENVYERWIDTLLASPAFGERMAMGWLDLARYSDTHGYQDDLPRTMWPWRDWVIKAFNENMPYDRFVSLQLAGDLLPDKNKETLLASAFNRNHKISQEGGIIDEEYRAEYVADRTNTFGKAFLGLTMECSRCHDHKYDPITMREYYGLSAYFNKVPERGFVPNLQVPKPFIRISKTDLEGELKFLNAREAIKTEKDTIFQMVMEDSLAKGGRITRILLRGQYDRPGDTVGENTPQKILPLDPALPKNRLGLAQWLFHPSHPLTARVTVNRLWQDVFGRGIVFTTENFGVQGALPSHPELLDWLAVEFRESGWNVKHMLRLMLTSAVYRQSSAVSAELYQKDPENIFLSRGPRYRLPYEFIRDQVLAVSGLLENIIGGPSVKPWQPPGLWEEISTEESANNFRGEFAYAADTAAGKRYRRSLYTYHKRTVPPPAPLLFDAPMRDNCEVRRTRTATPLQALALLNDRQIWEAARVYAQKLLENNSLGSPEDKILSAFSAALLRKPAKSELADLLELYRDEYKRYSDSPEKARKMLRPGLYPVDESLHPAEHAALTAVVGVIFNLDEMINKT